jgi:oligosaccharyltransferase complex subunit alpha (ribophorin I)
VVLPEGARDPTVDTPLRLVGGGPSLSTEYTYLDVMGRPVVVLRLANAVPEMNSLLTVGGRCGGWGVNGRCGWEGLVL